MKNIQILAVALSQLVCGLFLIGAAVLQYRSSEDIVDAVDFLVSAIPSDPSYVTINSQAAIQRSAADCRSYTAATTVNIWTNAPAEVLTAPIAPQIRYVEISSEVDSLTPFASEYASVRVGPATDTPTLSLTNGSRIRSGGTRQVQVVRATNGAATGFPIWFRPQATGVYCMTYYW